jgi:hypothetical protein
MLSRHWHVLPTLCVADWRPGTISCTYFKIPGTLPVIQLFPAEDAGEVCISGRHCYQQDPLFDSFAKLEEGELKNLESAWNRTVLFALLQTCLSCFVSNLPSRLTYVKINLQSGLVEASAEEGIKSSWWGLALGRSFPSKSQVYWNLTLESG